MRALEQFGRGLTAYDRETPHHKALIEAIESRIDELRQHNDGGLSPEETAATRGAIRELKRWRAALSGEIMTHDEIITY